MPQGDKLRAAADFLDRVIFPPRKKLGENAERTATACAAAHVAQVRARGYCKIIKAGRECWMCSYKLRLRRKVAKHG